MGGPLAGMARGLLRCGALGYGVAIGVRNGFYRRGLFKSHNLDATVISIGNLTAGGTGKTPLVVWLCNLLTGDQESPSGLSVAILTRGYKSRTQDSEPSHQKPKNLKDNQVTTPANDEPALLARACPSVPVVINPDRVAGAEEAIEECGAQVLILDDGFQHRRLGRNLDIVTIDATCPFGYDHLLPAGLLREPVVSLKRAQAAVITRCDQISTVAREGILKSLQRIHPDMVVAQTRHAPTMVHGKDFESFPSEQLKGQRVFAFCGLGNPDGFYQTLRVLGVHLVGTLSFNDHHRCTSRELLGIWEQAQRTRADLILTTEKNWFGLPETDPHSTIPLGFLGVELAFMSGEETLVSLIEETLTGTIPA